MRAYEIVGKLLTENVFKTIGQDIKGAVTEPFQKLKAISSTPGAWTSASKAGQALDRSERAQAFADISQREQQKAAQIAQQTQQRARELAQQWAQQVKTQTAQQQPQPSVASGIKVSPTPTVTIGSVGKLTKGDGGYWYNEKGQPVTDPAQAAKIDKAYQDQELRKKQFQQTAMVKERRINDPQQTAALRTQRAQTRKGTTPANDPMGFVAWSDEQLASNIPGTQHTITMDKIKNDPTLGQPVKTALSQVLRDPANQAAVEKYFQTAMTAMQQYSQNFKKSAGISDYKSDTTGGTLSTVISPRQVQDLKNLARDPAAANQIKTELGLR